ncbi:MAG TPA: hypothetical protein VGU20_01185 [Stellaceae bacterium]|nr:hypothetical protein [Stellaceae bacterium]
MNAAAEELVRIIAQVAVARHLGAQVADERLPEPRNEASTPAPMAARSEQ